MIFTVSKMTGLIIYKKSIVNISSSLCLSNGVK